MSKIRCTCDHIILDQTDFISYKGEVFMDVDSENIYEGTAKEISSFIDACINNSREEWIINRFGESYPEDSDNSSVIYNIISDNNYKFSKVIYQCESCSSLLLETDETNNFEVFKPMNESQAKNILKSNAVK